MTKREVLNYLKDTILVTINDEEKRDAVATYIEKELALLDKKNLSSKTYAAKKRAEDDAMTDAILAVLTDELQTIDDIVSLINDENATKHKVQTRLSKLHGANRANKGTVSVEKRKLVAYSLPSEV